METIWTFKTARFRVVVSAEPEYDIDLSWDEDGSVRDGLESGRYVAFCAKAAVYLDGDEIAADYLGECIYENPADFRDHIGARGQYGSDFVDMVKTAIDEARAEIRRRLANPPRVRVAA